MSWVVEEYWAICDDWAPSDEEFDTEKEAIAFMETQIQLHSHDSFRIREKPSTTA